MLCYVMLCYVVGCCVQTHSCCARVAFLRFVRGLVWGVGTVEWRREEVWCTCCGFDLLRACVTRMHGYCLTTVCLHPPVVEHSGMLGCQPQQSHY
jgi:hypothetical protein